MCTPKIDRFFIATLKSEARILKTLFIFATD